jgi:hypothetical protein
MAFGCGLGWLLPQFNTLTFGLLKKSRVTNRERLKVLVVPELYTFRIARASSSRLMVMAPKA